MAKADMFLKIDGAKTGVIKGESSVPEHLEEIEINEWSWGMTSPNALGGVGQTATTALSNIRFGKNTDSSTPAMMAVMRTNENIKKAVLTVRKAGANPPVDFLVVTLENARLTSATIGTATPGSPTLVESFAMAFETITIAYAPQLKGGSKGAQNSWRGDVHPNH